MLRTLVGTIAALLMTLPLAGCGDAPGPTTQPRSSTPVTRTTPDPSPTETTSAPPTVAPPGETARQFIRRWVELTNYMQQTGDTQPFADLAGPDCVSCNRLIKTVRKIYRNGGSVDTAGAIILKMSQGAPGEWTLTLREAPTSYVKRSGGKTIELPGGRYRMRLYIAPLHGTYVIATYGKLQ